LLELIDRESEFTSTLMAKLDSDLQITADANPEVKERWYPLGIRKGYMPVFEPAHEFVSVQGRMKYLNPIYGALWDYGYQTTALMWFEENEDFYHPIAVQTLKTNIFSDPSASEEEVLATKRRLR